MKPGVNLEQNPVYYGAYNIYFVVDVYGREGD